MHRSSSIQVTTCPITVSKHLLTLLNDTQIITHTLGRCFPRCRLVEFTSLLVHKSMNRTGTTTINHNDLVILLTTLNHIINVTLTRLEFNNLAKVILVSGTVRICFRNRKIKNGALMTTDAVLTEVVLESINQHVAPLGHIELDCVAGILLSNILVKGGSSHERCLFELKSV